MSTKSSEIDRVKIFYALADSNDEVRRAAKSRVTALEGAELSALCTALLILPPSRTTIHMSRVPVFVAIVATALLVGWRSYASGRDSALCALVPGVIIIVSIGCLLKDEPVGVDLRLAQRSICEALGTFNDPNQLATLLEPNRSPEHGRYAEWWPGATAGRFRDISAAIWAAIARILPIASDADLRKLSELAQRTLLSPLSAPYDNVDATLTCINALARIDPTRIPPRLSALAAEPAATTNMKIVRDAARAAIARMTAERDRQNEATTLLRASQPTVADSSELVRPAELGSETPPEQLLRPGT